MSSLASSPRDRLRPVRIVVVMLGLIGLGGCYEEANAEYTVPAFDGEVTEVSANGQFKLSCCDRWLELRMARFSSVPLSSEVLADVTRMLRAAGPLRCTAYPVGDPHNSSQPTAVWCNAPDDSLISERLIRAGLAEEACEPSANQVGSCS